MDGKDVHGVQADSWCNDFIEHKCRKLVLETRRSHVGDKHNKKVCAVLDTDAEDQHLALSSNRPRPRPVVTAPATAANSRCCAMANVSGFACTGVTEPTTPETSRIMAPAPIRCSAPPPTLQSVRKRIAEPVCVRLHELQDRLASPARGSVGRRSRSLNAQLLVADA